MSDGSNGEWLIAPNRKSAGRCFIGEDGLVLALLVECGTDGKYYLGFHVNGYCDQMPVMSGKTLEAGMKCGDAFAKEQTDKRKARLN